MKWKTHWIDDFVNGSWGRLCDTHGFPPQNTFPVVLITNELAIQSVAPGLPSVYVDAQCDEGSHLFPATDLSLTRPLEPKAALTLTSNSCKDASCDQREGDRKQEKRREEKCLPTPHSPANRPHTHTHTHTKQSGRYTIKALREKCPSQKWWADTLNLTVDYMGKDRLCF